MRDVVETTIDDLWACAGVEAVQRLTALAAKTLSVANATLRSSTEERRVIAGLGNGVLDTSSGGPCDIVLATGQPVVLPDCRTPNGRGGYLGVPLRLGAHRLLGTLAVVDERPRAWTVDEVNLLADFAKLVCDHIDLSHRLAQRIDLDETRLAEMVDANHELRTPLQAIVGFTEFLKTETRRDMIVAHARNIQAAAESLLGIVNLTLEAASPEPTVETMPVDLAEFARTALSMVGPTAVEKGLHSRLEIAVDVPPIVAIDRQRVFQALLNLLNNAVKFTETGGFELGIERHGEALRFSVSDTGIGILPEKRDLLFQRFSRIDGDGRATDGSGLGLAITKGLVESLGGRIGLMPRTPQGTIFWFDLPDVAALDASGTSPPARASAPTVGVGATCILVVDDLDLNRKLIVDMLSIDGHAVDCAADGETAVRMAAEKAYDLVLMDMVMPGMNGLDAARTIRSLPSPFCDVPIVALTAHTGPDELASCLAAGMNATLTKPMTFDSLTSAVSVWARPCWEAA